MSISRRTTPTRFAATTLLATGTVSFVAGTLFAGPSLAAPSSVLELDGNIRSDGALDWGRSGGVTGTQGAFDGGAFVDATNPPVPPVPTSTLTATPGVLAAAFAVDPIDVDANACSPGHGTASGDPTVFTGRGGEKNGDRIDTMTFSTGSVPNKDDLSNVYAVSYRPAGGTSQVLFGAERLVNDGDSHVDFELLHAATSRPDACSGGFAGDRSQGDLVVSVDFTNGGALADVTVHQWHCADEASPQPADATVCNPDANGPTVAHYQDVTTVPAIAAAVDARVNADAEAACGGWACRAANGTEISTLATNTFLEGGIDVAATGFGGCDATLFPHTRTAQQFTATLVDFAGPMPLGLCARPLISTTSTPTGGGVPLGASATDLATATDGGVAVTTGAITFFLCPPADVTTAGCPAGGTQIGAPQALDAAGHAGSAVAAGVTSSPGTYCWRAEFTPAEGSGLRSSTHTNAGSECFTTVAAVTTTTTTTTTPPPPGTPPPPADLGISARTIERPAPPAGRAPEVLGVILTAPTDQVAAARLARTGVSIRPQLIAAGVLLMIGGALVLGARPRRARGR
ncbi:MAG TPA: hypothetical protein VHM89_04700 [Acidimicrobiales bacterium]|nr:hypothetical protein [Acidimicrobiales bacterium]